MTARGETLRKDDNPEVLKGRLAAYRAQTAPLADYYAAKGMLKSVDGMAPIDAVTAAIDRILSPAAPRKAKPARRKAKAAKRQSAKRAAKRRRPRASRRRTPATRSKTRKTRRKPAPPGQAPKTRLDSANRVPGGG